MKGESSTFSLLTSWMLPKPKAEGEQPEHSTTPFPTEAADGSQGAENPKKDQTPTEVVHSPEYYFEQNAAYENDDGSDDSDDLATDEATAIAEAMVEAAALNTTLHCHLGAKRQHEDDAQPEVPQQV